MVELPGTELPARLRAKALQARPSKDSSNCHWQFSPSRAVPFLKLTKEKTQLLLGPFFGGAAGYCPRVR